MRILLRHLLTCCFLVGLCAPWTGAADRLEEFKGAKRDLVQKLRSKQSLDRVEALKKLQKFPIEDAVRLIHGALDDPAPEVRKLAYDSLEGMNGNLEVCETLLQMVKQGAHSKQGPAKAIAPLSILLSSQLRSTQRDVDELLEADASTPSGPRLMIALVDEMAARHSPDDVARLAQLTKTRVFESHFGVRRTVVHALTLIPAKQALGLLIEIMGRVGGEARADAVEYLTQVTGQIFGMESAAWQRWWHEAKGTFVYPSRVVRTPYRTTITESTEGYYYGMPLFAERLVFVLDTSGSMSGPRIDAAQRELVKAIGGLPDHAHFGLIVFNGAVHVWQHQLVPANDKNKATAISYVINQGTMSSTASYDALEAALAFDTEAIYFLSDGAPTSGKIVAPADIVAAITAANQVRRVSLYTIGIGAGFPGSPLDVFLQTLAEQNLGLYRRVDN